MKKTICIVLSLVMTAGLLTGCKSTSAPESDSEKLRIVTTIFPEYDWVREILGQRADHAELTMLLDDGVDLHSFQPTADDMVTISNCDLFIYTGGESDAWVEDILTSTASGPAALNLMEVLGDGVKAEEAVEGMQEEAHAHEEDADHEEELDEHIWLSLKNAALLCEAIAAALGAVDPAYESVYADNAATYIQQLRDLDSRYQAAVEAAPRRTLLFADRFPFRYLVDDYGLAYYAAFSGCSAETEASFETVAFLAGKVDELSLPCVLTIEGADGKVAQTVLRNTREQNQAVLQLNSMQSVTSADVASGTAYLSVMEKNLETLTAALG